ncbi:MAG: arylesterase [Halieaceae bacterium]|jgi:acyl-CoA thioesterase-1|nr:arylesterase [Halieaceae bacterium]
MLSTVLKKLVRPAASAVTAALLIIGTVQAAGSPAKTVLVMGDSISAAYGMSLDEGWVALLAGRLADSHPDYQVVNASISGETSAGAAARLPALLEQHQPSVVIIELGGNDGLRGYPVNRLRDNLSAMAQQSQAAGAGVLILAMEIPPNYGTRYTKSFRESFTRVANDTGSQLSPFMLNGVATDPALMQDDGIHPTVEAQQLLLDNVWPHLQPLL